jgi:hypothetical protein
MMTGHSALAEDEKGEVSGKAGSFTVEPPDAAGTQTEFYCKK